MVLVSSYPQLGQGAVPRALYSFTAMRSWRASEAFAGSPVPPQRSQVAWSNWYLPRYWPLGETARGLPPDSHWAIRLSAAGTWTLEPPPEPLLPLLPLPPDSADAPP